MVGVGVETFGAISNSVTAWTSGQFFFITLGTKSSQFSVVVIKMESLVILATTVADGPAR
jgi:hypothetical protein